jgi:hypothetical protein
MEWENLARHDRHGHHHHHHHHHHDHLERRSLPSVNISPRTHPYQQARPEGHGKKKQKNRVTFD